MSLSKTSNETQKIEDSDDVMSSEFLNKMANSTVEENFHFWDHFDTLPKSIKEVMYSMAYCPSPRHVSIFYKKTNEMMTCHMLKHLDQLRYDIHNARLERQSMQGIKYDQPLTKEEFEYYTLNF